VGVLPSVEHHCSPSTVNRKLSALSAFYQHAARNGARRLRPTAAGSLPVEVAVHDTARQARAVRDKDAVC
jgi:site-specific recombinase XerD